MKIVQIAPLYERVPPNFYGGTERIVSYLTEELVRQGHQVTLFASGDSITKADLVSCSRRALRLDQNVADALPHHLLMLERVRQCAAAFDVLHFHIDLLHFSMVRSLARPTVTTVHGRLDLVDIAPLYALFSDLPLVSVSDDQRTPLLGANWISTVHHALPTDLLPFQPFPQGGYLAFLGRISPEKRPDLAIEIAKQAGLPLKIAAKVDKADQAYWEKIIEPMVRSQSNVEFIGEIDEAEKANFLGQAIALLFPINWPEPFGLVMIEAFACGTPVIAFRHGSVAEVVEHEVSGFIVEDLAEAVECTKQIGNLSRIEVRQAFERRFTVERMASDYLKVYAAMCS
jgi:glycosyltransferase involved in cell wall biosynthesis